ncbi:MAG: hypothetical protein ACRD5Z_19495, partial [Bryobacteraceae bacterium]
VQTWLSFRCWRLFSSGDLLRPAWLLIAFSGLAQLAGGALRIAALPSPLNPLTFLPASAGRRLMSWAAICGPLFSPIYMLFLAGGLFYVVRACRQHGILGRLRALDILLLSIALVYTTNFVATVIFAPTQSTSTTFTQTVLSWTSDPLLCLLLFQAILVRRSVANMGWGLIARCWLSFTAAIFLTSVGDIGLWAWSKGVLPHVLEIASWYIWFLASAAYALGPAFQLQAMLHATLGGVIEGAPNDIEPATWRAGCA